MNIPATVFVALGAVLAALIAGFFSVLSLVASKENKVSEFRLAWIDGLRNEVAGYISSVQELVRIEATRKYLENTVVEGVDREFEFTWFQLSRAAYDKTVECLSRIHLRLNPKHANDPRQSEYELWRCVKEAQTLFNNEEYEAAAKSCSHIRDAAAPLLKSTWDLVKKGELSYRIIRWSSILMVVLATTLFALSIFVFWGEKLGWSAFLK